MYKRQVQRHHCRVGSGRNNDIIIERTDSCPGAEAFRKDFCTEPFVLPAGPNSFMATVETVGDFKKWRLASKLLRSLKENYDLPQTAITKTINNRKKTASFPPSRETASAIKQYYIELAFWVSDNQNVDTISAPVLLPRRLSSWGSVSYTHLDVYKRQLPVCVTMSSNIV